MSDEGGFDLGGLLEQAQAMQQQMAVAQEAQANTVVQGSSGGGIVAVEMTGAGEFRSVSIKPEAIEDGDVEMLEDLVLAALRDAAAKVMEIQQDSMGGFEMPDIGGLGGLLGGS
jgi:DNA-binding YbaB/EbfC family protein